MLRNNEKAMQRLDVRATRTQAKLIRLAAKESHVNVSNFVLQSACLRAEEVLDSKQHFELKPRLWTAFLAVLDRPSQTKPRLSRLLIKPGVLER